MHILLISNCSIAVLVAPFSAAAQFVIGGNAFSSNPVLNNSMIWFCLLP
jgi:hypothetical protein